METKKKKLIISKEVISSLNDVSLNNVKGGGNMEVLEDNEAQWSGGCTDGCGGSLLFCTWLNCTKADCTADCGTHFCDTKAFCTC